MEIKTNISVGDVLKPAKTTGPDEIREWDKNKTGVLQVLVIKFDESVFF